MDSSGRTRSGQTGRLASCRIGNVDVPRQRCGIADFSDFNGPSSSPLRMLVGLPLISQATWAFDFPCQRWTVYRWQRSQRFGAVPVLSPIGGTGCRPAVKSVRSLAHTEPLRYTRTHTELPS